MGIDTYITVAFWFGIFGIGVRMLMIAFMDYPRKPEVNLGTDVFIILISAFFLAWVSYLKFYA